MKKKVALFAKGNPELKLMLPIIQELILNNQIKPILITSKTMNTGPKKKQNYKICYNPFHSQISVCYVDSENEINKILIQERIRTIILSWYLPNVFNELKKKDICVLYLQHSFDIILWPYLYGKDTFHLFDGFLLFSTYWKEELLKTLQNVYFINSQELKKIEEKLFIVGFPELDQIASYDKEKIRKKYGFGQKKIIFFDPVDFFNRTPNFLFRYYFSVNGTWKSKSKKVFLNLCQDIKYNFTRLHTFPSHFFRLINNGKNIYRYDDLFFHLRRYCKENNYLLICKSREKNNDPDWVKKECDYYSFDQGYFPFTLLEMLFVSDFYVGFNSTSVLEAVYCDVPVKIFQVFPTEFRYGRGYEEAFLRYIENCMENTDEWLYYPNVVDVTFWDQDIVNVFKTLKDISFDRIRRQQYKRKFLGHTDAQSSRRVCEVISYKLK